MAGIYTMATLTWVVAAGAWGGLVAFVGRLGRTTVVLIAVGLPLSAVVNLLVKRPLLGAAGIPTDVAAGLGFGQVIFVLLLIGASEELIKVTPLLLGPVRGTLVSAERALWVGAALGLGFGLGEIAYLAWRIAGTPRYADTPWYLFTGFLSERVIATFVHMALTALFVLGVYRGGRAMLRAALLVISLHAAVDLAPLLFQIGMIPSSVASLYLLGFFVALLFALERVRHSVATISTPPTTVLYERPPRDQAR